MSVCGCSEEEVSFGKTLDKGIARLKKAAAAAKSQNQKHIDSKDAFEMWDTYGFPVDLTQVSHRQTVAVLQNSWTLCKLTILLSFVGSVVSKTDHLLADRGPEDHT